MDHQEFKNQGQGFYASAVHSPEYRIQSLERSVLALQFSLNLVADDLEKVSGNRKRIQFPFQVDYGMNIQNSMDLEHIVFRTDAKLFHMVGGKWEICGSETGLMMIIRNNITFCSRILMVPHTDEVGEASAKHDITPNMKLNPFKLDKDKMSFTWTADEKENNQITRKIYLVCFPNVEAAQAFREVFEFGIEEAKKVSQKLAAAITPPPPPPPPPAAK